MEVAGIYTSKQKAESAYLKILKNENTKNDVLLYVPEDDQTMEFSHEMATKAPYGAFYGAIIGILVGMFFGRFFF